MRSSRPLQKRAAVPSVRRRRRAAACVVLAALTLCLAGRTAAAAPQPPTARIQRSQELLDEAQRQEQELRLDRVFVRDVVVEGAVLPAEEIERETAAFKGAWLSADDIERLIARIREVCIRHGLEAAAVNIAARVQGETLYIGITVRRNNVDEASL
ncbi:MAG: POTRA domain-containing protein [Deltaproteobacteria bacterium]